MTTKNYLSIYAKSFNWSGFFLPKKIYNKCSVLYDFCRTLDNIADQNKDLEIKKKELGQFRNKFEQKKTTPQRHPATKPGKNRSRKHVAHLSKIY